MFSGPSLGLRKEQVVVGSSRAQGRGETVPTHFITSLELFPILLFPVMGETGFQGPQALGRRDRAQGRDWPCPPIAPLRVAWSLGLGLGALAVGKEAEMKPRGCHTGPLGYLLQGKEGGGAIGAP